MKISYRQIQLICMIYIVAWMIAPPLAYDAIFRLLAVAAAVIWLFLQSCMRKKSENLKASRHLQYYLLGAGIYVTVLLIFQCVYNSMTLWEAFYSNITTCILLFVGYIGGVYCRERRYEELKKILYFIIVIAVVFSITSIFRSSEYYEFTRNAGGDIDEENIILARNAAMHGVGAFGFFCFTSVLSPLLLWTSYSYKGRKKALYIVSFLVVEIGVLSAGYTLALLISIVGISFCMIFKMKSIVGKLIIVLLLPIVIMYWDQISVSLYSFLTSLAEGTMYEVKVQDIFSFLIGGESTGTFEARQERYLWSFNSIFWYPILGSYILAGIRSAGNHSSILDTFAIYGWGIGSIWMYIISIFPWKIANVKKRGYAIMVFLLLFLTALFNTYTMTMGVFYLVVPAILSVSSKDNHF